MLPSVTGTDCPTLSYRSAVRALSGSRPLGLPTSGLVWRAMAALRSPVWIAAVVATSAACGGSDPSVGSIVLESDRDGEPEIFVLDRDGGAPLQLTDNDVFDGNPDWSPDGSRLVFTSGTATVVSRST